MSDATALVDAIKARNIQEIVHFTSNHGLVGALETGFVLSRRQLPINKHLAYLAAPTSKYRQEATAHFDKSEDWLDYVNLSVSEINFHYFNIADTKWHASDDRWWAILSFTPNILTHSGVYFSTTNNVYEHTIRGAGLSGFETLFNDPIRRKASWFAARRSRSCNLPTCQQAEALYPQAVSLEHLLKIYVRNDEHHDLAKGWLRFYKRNGIQVVTDPNKFNGQPN